jgi:hypothetical protein
MAPVKKMLWIVAIVIVWIPAYMVGTLHPHGGKITVFMLVLALFCRVIYLKYLR